MQPTEEMTEKSCIFADNNQRFENMEYKHRIADQMLAKKLASKGAILIINKETYEFFQSLMIA